MARLELFPLSLSEISNQPLNIIDYLLKGTSNQALFHFTSREELAGFVLRGGYPEAQSKSPRAKQAWFNSYMEGGCTKISKHFTPPAVTIIRNYRLWLLILQG